jgi:plastocyanin
MFTTLGCGSRRLRAFFQSQRGLEYIMRLGHPYLRTHLLIAAGVFAMACSDSSQPATNTTVSMQDQCDPATFNATLGAGACTRQGTMTLSQFNAELAANHSVAAWQFSPSTFSIHVGDVITARNDGGETHTFTEVDQFGGGVVPALNTASGNPVEAPECAQLTSTDQVAAGAVFHTDPAAHSGTEYYQCCIHPWMRATVTVTQ